MIIIHRIIVYNMIYDNEFSAPARKDRDGDNARAVR